MSANGSKMMYLAVLPAYRRACIEALREILPTVQIWCSTAHLDPTVRTGIPDAYFRTASMVRIARRFFFQYGGIHKALRADDLIVDLNPRSITAWLLLLMRRPTSRRTIVWGHLYPQKGADANSRGLRFAMRRLADGVITYTYENERAASTDLARKPVWVAPNALYSLDQFAEPAPAEESREGVIYVGRFEPAKKVDRLVRAFAKFREDAPTARLILVGGGSQLSTIQALAADLGIEKYIEFPGWVEDYDQLARLYGRSFVSASPGFAGLGLTQSLGFGVPMVVSTDEPHSPEIELSDTGGVLWADSGDESSFSSELLRAWALKDTVPVAEYRSYVQERYSAEAMAGGLAAALENRDGKNDD